MNLLTDAEMYLRAVESRTQPPAEPTPCPSGELTLNALPVEADCKILLVTNDDALAAEILADRLEEQGCRDDAQLVRRLAGLTGPPSP